MSPLLTRDEALRLEEPTRTRALALVDAYEAERAEAEQYRLRLAGALTAADGYFTRAMRDEPTTVEFIKHCPTIDTVIRRMEERNEARARVAKLRAALGGLLPDDDQWQEARDAADDACVDLVASVGAIRAAFRAVSP